MISSARRRAALTVATVLLVTACAPAPASPAPASLPTVLEPSGAATTPPLVACGGEPLQARWWHDRVFYEIFVRSFADSDGDGIGDLRGLTAHLDDLNDGNPGTSTDLGITGIWLMPVAEAASYHGLGASPDGVKWLAGRLRLGVIGGG